jgi:hypothetical protein
MVKLLLIWSRWLASHNQLISSARRRGRGCERSEHRRSLRSRLGLDGGEHTGTLKFTRASQAVDFRRLKIEIVDRLRRGRERAAPGKVQVNGLRPEAVNACGEVVNGLRPEAVNACGEVVSWLRQRNVHACSGLRTRRRRARPRPKGVHALAEGVHDHSGRRPVHVRPPQAAHVRPPQAAHVPRRRRSRPRPKGVHAPAAGAHDHPGRRPVHVPPPQAAHVPPPQAVHGPAAGGLARAAGAASTSTLARQGDLPPQQQLLQSSCIAAAQMNNAE